MLEIRSIGKRYPDGTIGLEEFSLAVGEGVLGLLGGNGAGKTTLMSLLATVTRPTSGTFLWEGRDGVADPLAVRRVLGYLPQDFGVYAHLTAASSSRTSAGSRASRGAVSAPRAASCSSW